ncbi:glycosyltransferase family 4 protein [Candidatus Parcubacteria bacterium]|nr:glycosyltransferase family 4 protein [Candidatus Parcubacteria bacterium]
MLNIISKSYVSNKISGPKKVVDNLIKGLEKINYPYCINKSLDSTSQLWIHDDKKALKKASELNIKAVVGPNLYITPREIPKELNLDNVVYIHPSKWAMDFWKDFGFDRCKLDYWPTGIDTDFFKERDKDNANEVLVYFKERYPEELDYVEKILEEKNIKYEIIHYGNYKEKDYIDKLNKTKYIIWVGRQESQGIALQEAMSMNIPILVWDVKNIGHWVNSKKHKIFNKDELSYENTSSAYFFNEDCGIKTKIKTEIPEKINYMESEWKSFSPRKFIIDNLNLEKQAKELLLLYQKYFNIFFEDGSAESSKNTKKWENDKIIFKLKTKIKDLIKRLV